MARQARRCDVAWWMAWQARWRGVAWWMIRQAQRCSVAWHGMVDGMKLGGTAWWSLWWDQHGYERAIERARQRWELREPDEERDMCWEVREKVNKIIIKTLAFLSIPSHIWECTVVACKNFEIWNILWTLVFGVWCIKYQIFDIWHT